MDECTGWAPQVAVKVIGYWNRLKIVRLVSSVRPPSPQTCLRRSTYISSGFHELILPLHLLLLNSSDSNIRGTEKRQILGGPLEDQNEQIANEDQGREGEGESLRTQFRMRREEHSEDNLLMNREKKVAMEEDDNWTQTQDRERENVEVEMAEGTEKCREDKTPEKNKRQMHKCLKQGEKSNKSRKRREMEDDQDRVLTINRTRTENKVETEREVTEREARMWTDSKTVAKAETQTAQEIRTGISEANKTWTQPGRETKITSGIKTSPGTDPETRTWTDPGIETVTRREINIRRDKETELRTRAAEITIKSGRRIEIETRTGKGEIEEEENLSHRKRRDVWRSPDLLDTSRECLIDIRLKPTCPKLNTPVQEGRPT